MPYTSTPRKQGDDGPPDGSGFNTPVAQRIRIGNSSVGDNEKQSLNKRLRDAEICVPIVYGTMAFWLGRKATETQSHKWTVYVRGANNEDLSIVIKRVEFRLHPSFTNPLREVKSPPFELSECGWGEFEISISLFFHSDVCERKLDLSHHLKLYSEVDTGPQSTKKPVIVESYDEIVFPDPSEEFFARVQKHPAIIVPRIPSFNLPPSTFVPNQYLSSINLNSSDIGLSTEPVEDTLEKKRGDTKDHPLSQWFINFSEADELLKLAAARQQVQAYIVKLRRQLSVMEVPPSQGNQAMISRNQ